MILIYFKQFVILWENWNLMDDQQREFLREKEKLRNLVKICINQIGMEKL